MAVPGRHRYLAVNVRQKSVGEVCGYQKPLTSQIFVKVVGVVIVIQNSKNWGNTNKISLVEGR